jgi:hypothetical protein
MNLCVAHQWSMTHCQATRTTCTSNIIAWDIHQYSCHECSMPTSHSWMWIDVNRRHTSNHPNALGKTIYTFLSKTKSTRAITVRTTNGVFVWDDIESISHQTTKKMTMFLSDEQHNYCDWRVYTIFRCFVRFVCHRNVCAVLSTSHSQANTVLSLFVSHRSNISE